MRYVILLTVVLLELTGFNSESKAMQQGGLASQKGSFNILVSENNISSKKSEKVTLESLIEEAVNQNPKIMALEERWESAKLRIPQAGAWMDPKLNVNIMNFPVSEFSFNLEPMTQKQISFMQTIPFPGITSLKERIAAEETEIAEYSYSDTKNSVIKDVSLAYYDIFLIDKSVEITLKNKQILNDFITIASKKYEVGGGLQQDVLKAQVEFSKLLDKLITLRKRREAVAARLNTLLNRHTSTIIGSLADVHYAPVELNVQTLQNIAEENRSMLQGMRTSVQRNKTALKLAKKQYLPNFSVGIAYSQRDKRRDFFTAQFSVNLPIWSNRKQDKKVEETQHNVFVAEKMYEDSKNEIDSRIAALLSSLEETDERIQLLKNVIIPQAAQSLNSAISGYQVNKVDFLMLLNNQLTLFNFELDYYRLLTTYKKDLSTLEFVIGQPVNSNDNQKIEGENNGTK